MLKQAREQRGESLRSAARGLGVNPAYLSRIESGERQPSEEVRRRADRYYEIDEDLVELAAGEVPADVLAILQQHPELIERIRAEFGQ